MTESVQDVPTHPSATWMNLEVQHRYGVHDRCSRFHNDTLFLYTWWRLGRTWNNSLWDADMELQIRYYKLISLYGD